MQYFDRTDLNFRLRNFTSGIFSRESKKIVKTFVDDVLLSTNCLKKIEHAMKKSIKNY